MTSKQQHVACTEPAALPINEVGARLRGHVSQKVHRHRTYEQNAATDFHHA